MLSFLPALLIFAGWLLERRARKRVERSLGHSIRLNKNLHDALLKRAEEVGDLKSQNLALADRVAQQSQLLSRAAEAKAESERRLGYLFPRGLETPPSREDALSPTWCREEKCECGTYGWAPEMGVWVDGHHPNCPKVGGHSPLVAVSNEGVVTRKGNGLKFSSILAEAQKGRTQCQITRRGVPCSRAAVLKGGLLFACVECWEGLQEERERQGLIREYAETLVPERTSAQPR